HAANPVRQRPAGAINRQSFAAILDLLARFKAVRQRQGLTLAEVAERMGGDPPALSRLETGKMLNPTLATLLKWAEALGQKLYVDLSPAGPSDPSPRPLEKCAPKPGWRRIVTGGADGTIKVWNAVRPSEQLC